MKEPIYSCFDSHKDHAPTTITEDSFPELFEILDVDGSGQLDQREFIDGLLKLWHSSSISICFIKHLLLHAFATLPKKSEQLNLLSGTCNTNTLDICYTQLESSGQLFHDHLRFFWKWKGYEEKGTGKRPRKRNTWKLSWSRKRRKHFAYPWMIIIA